MNSPLPLKRLNFALGVALAILMAALFAPWQAQVEAQEVVFRPTLQHAPVFVLAADTLDSSPKFNKRSDAPSTVGPLEVIEYSADKLVLASGRVPLVIGLQGKKVTIKDEQATEGKAVEIKAGTRVTVTTKANDVQIMVVPKREDKHGYAL